MSGARFMSCISVLSIVFPIVGCDAGTSAKIVTPQVSQEPRGGSFVPHPQHKHWSQFPVGAESVRKKEVRNKNGSVFVITKWTLVEKSEQRVTVRQQVTVIRPESTKENEPQDMTFPARFQLPDGLTEEMFALPSLKAKLQGKEQIEAAGRKYDAELYTWDEINEAGPMSVRLWRNGSVPGQWLREEMVIQRNGDSSVEELLTVTIPEASALTPTPTTESSRLTPAPHERIASARWVPPS